MKLDRIVVIGAGNGRHATAVDLSTRGYSVCLYEFSEFSQKLRNKIAPRTIQSTGFIGGKTEVDLITIDEREAAQYSKVILVTMPLFGHQKFFDIFKDRLQDGSNLYFLSGNLSTLISSETTKFVERGITFVEFNSLPYGCRLSEDGTINILIKTSLLTYAAFPGKDTARVVDDVEKLYQQHKSAIDILEVSLNNPNPLVHPLRVLFNLGKMEHSQGQFYMYNKGMTDSIFRAIKCINEERLALGKELGYDLIDFDGFKGTLLGGSEKSFIDRGRSANLLGPCTSENRYLTEDVQFGLVYFGEIVKKIGLQTPTIDSVINLSSVVCGQRFNNHCDDIVILPSGKDKIREFLYHGE